MYIYVFTNAPSAFTPVTISLISFAVVRSFVCLFVSLIAASLQVAWLLH
jgi:hypothetical protein